TDRVIVAVHGSITNIFDTHGEAHFRALEREAVREALASKEHGERVVALGGGAILNADTQHELAQHRVALITVTAEAVRERLNTSKRPLLAGGMESWVRLAEERRPIYESLADSVWDTSHLPVSLIAQRVAEWVRQGATGKDGAVRREGSE
ncbi:MAG TPA: shikimate kinase, partial [Terrimesophilobacter sp.]|nr:shikimate kinase [Terrimesophilobacter sp.]